MFTLSWLVLKHEKEIKKFSAPPPPSEIHFSPQLESFSKAISVISPRWWSPLCWRRRIPSSYLAAPPPGVALLTLWKVIFTFLSLSHFGSVVGDFLLQTPQLMEDWGIPWLEQNLMIKKNWFGKRLFFYFIYFSFYIFDYNLFLNCNIYIMSNEAIHWSWQFIWLLNLLSYTILLQNIHQKQD